MIPVNLGELATLLGGAEPVADNEALVTGFATDSREVEPGDLFIAIKGENVDGHDYVGTAMAHGATACLVERKVDVPCIVVEDVVQALAKMAGHYRNRFSGPVVGITGSAGKTTTKEFVTAALSPLGPVLKNEGNRNTEFTSPLVWTDLTPKHRAAVIEMGMRGFGQVAHLASFTRPTIGLITNIGFAHIELVGDRAGIARAKSELLEALPPDGTAVLWQEDDYLDLMKQRAGNRSVKTFGFSEAADCRIVRYEPTSWSSADVRGECDGTPWDAQIPAVGRHMALNAAAAVLTASLAGVSVQVAAEALRTATVPPMRMEVIELNGATVVIDCYNASPPSMVAALEILSELPVTGKRRAVLGEMRELGQATEEAHRELGRELARRNIDEVIFYGEPMSLAHEAAGRTDYEIAGSVEDVSRFLKRSAPGDAVLIKGSRALELERTLDPLVERCGH